MDELTTDNTEVIENNSCRVIIRKERSLDYLKGRPVVRHYWEVLSNLDGLDKINQYANYEEAKEFALFELMYDNRSPLRIALEQLPSSTLITFSGNDENPREKHSQDIIIFREELRANHLRHTENYTQIIFDCDCKHCQLHRA